MFKRRKPLTKLRLVREVFWPTMGWLRAFKYVKHRVIRLSDSSHKIALGLACGTAVSFTPLVGTHFIQAGIAAYFLRGNLLASLIGTFVGNPWTFPLLWWMSIESGSKIFSLFGISAKVNLPETMDFSILWEIATHEPLRLFLPWLVGGYLMALISAPISYFIFFNLVQGAKTAKAKAKIRRMHRIAREVTGQKK